MWWRRLGRLGSDPSGENEASDFQDDYERILYGGQPDAKNSRLRNIRELRGRERLQKKLIEKRLALTAAAPPRASGEEEEGGSGSTVWKPRLERLVRSSCFVLFWVQQWVFGDGMVMEVLKGTNAIPALSLRLLQKLVQEAGCCN